MWELLQPEACMARRKSFATVISWRQLTGL
jgi:hypothetical protein